MAMKVSVVGASGMAGGEVLRLILQDARFEITHLMGSSTAGDQMVMHHPQLHALHSHTIEEVSLAKLLESAVVFLSLPHGKSGEIAAELEKSNYTGVIVDIGADHRLELESDWGEFYGGRFFAPYAYGLPELTGAREKLAGAKRIAVPGCNVTAITLALQPAVAMGLIQLDDIVAVLANGYSGAGKALKADLLGVNALENAKPYALGGVHRHIPEIRQNIAKIHNLTQSENIAFEDVKVTFTPTLVPMVRGILATVSARLTPNAQGMLSDKSDANETLRKMYRDFYQDEPYIETLPAGVMPSTSAVSGTNYAHLAPVIDKQTGRLTCVAAIDNLVRGTAGQALQSLEIALGL
jgi:N-acetyl-gamma-glutamyl-phosphate reductase